MEIQNKENSFRTYNEEISNKSYFELLERYIIFDKISDFKKKYKCISDNMSS